MPKYREIEHLLPAERRGEVASILARGLVRWRRKIGRAGASPAQAPPEEAQEPAEGGQKLLAFQGETSVSVDSGTRGLRVRSDGGEV